MTQEPKIITPELLAKFEAKACEARRLDFFAGGTVSDTLDKLKETFEELFENVEDAFAKRCILQNQLNDEVVGLILGADFADNLFTDERIDQWVAEYDAQHLLRLDPEVRQKVCDDLKMLLFKEDQATKQKS